MLLHSLDFIVLPYYYSQASGLYNISALLLKDAADLLNELMMYVSSFYPTFNLFLCF